MKDIIQHTTRIKQNTTNNITEIILPEQKYENSCSNNYEKPIIGTLCK